ncbi:M20 family metallopeptidase [Desulfotalea psychrophila]|uniref:Related to IAA-amino acid hydrolase [Precursor] n=1 Tax=Desulfotalea psychrophila (strain LSv54 / DSM 12343) TaxID=177439 RepID=Q6AR41_DESPS|nr:M20 family metallopeptidase [Desulfotalea psychrophila]CAG35183.1 related to IAA-amino acid hydrolase [Precursor] [Desulfotalea psychrophila LSv54]
MRQKAEAIRDFIIGVRRQIHRYPELGYQEHKTAELIGGMLRDLGIEFRSGLGGTGIVAEFGPGGGARVLLRADMDALPIAEETGLSFSSQIEGCMHACGHDAHVAMVLGAASLLRNESFSGRVRLLFQPAEEGCYDDPDGFSGARRMIGEGVLAGVDAALALHQVPTLTSGTIALNSGAVMAASDIFEIVVRGRAAHAGASPQEGIDAILIASELVLGLQTVVSRQVSPFEVAVLSICTIEGGKAANIIADNVRLTGTIRALNSALQGRVRALVEQRCDALAGLYQTSISFSLLDSIPLTENSEMVVQLARDAVVEILGEEALLEVEPCMGAEDFSFIAGEVPSCLALLGTMPPESGTAPLHSPHMILDEDALPIGAAYLAQTALSLLRPGGLIQADLADDADRGLSG